MVSVETTLFTFYSSVVTTGYPAAVCLVVCALPVLKVHLT